MYVCENVSVGNFVSFFLFLFSFHTYIHTLHTYITYIHTLRVRSGWSVLMSSPAANGFLGAKGLAGLIPDVYRLIELQFIRDR